NPPNGTIEQAAPSFCGAGAQVANRVSGSALSRRRKELKMYHDLDRHERADVSLVGIIIVAVIVACMALLAWLAPAKAADLGGYKDGGRTAGLGVLLPQGTYASIGIGETFDTAGISSLTLSGQGA